MNLYRVTCYHNKDSKTSTFENLVIAGNEVEAKRIVEEEVWTLSGMEIKSVECVDMTMPCLLVSINTDDI